MSLAVPQSGIVAREQALARGMSRQQIRTLVNNGTWIEVHPGVYAVAGFPRASRQALIAACLWLDGLASHESAAWLFDLMDEPSISHVSAANGRSSPALRVHRCDDLEPYDRTRMDGVPCVTPTRLLCHLGGSIDEEELETVLEEALRRNLTSVDRLGRRVSALSGRGRRGIAPVKRLLSLRGDQPAAESQLEVRAIRLLRRARLFPVRQHPVGRRRIDLAFPDVKLGIELLGGGSHDGAAARARDAVRHNELAASGWTILYFTYEDVVHRPEYVVATVRAELARLRRSIALF